MGELVERKSSRCFGRQGKKAKNGVINFNLNMIKAPEYVIDYITLHK
jgi:predicted metal-dependent hydrolase